MRPCVLEYSCFKAMRTKFRNPNARDLKLAELCERYGHSRAEVVTLTKDAARPARQGGGLKTLSFATNMIHPEDRVYQDHDPPG